MDIIYLYNIKKDNKKALNAIKRRFYYNFNSKIAKKIQKLSKSAFLINEQDEELIDNFFKDYFDWISIFKAKLISFETITSKYSDLTNE